MENSDNRDVLVHIAETLERIENRLDENSGNLSHQIRQLSSQLEDATYEMSSLKRSLNQ